MTTFTYNQLPNGLLLADPPESMLGMTFRTMALLWLGRIPLHRNRLTTSLVTNTGSRCDTA